MDASAPKLPPKPIREQAKVLYAYEAQNEDELTIREGDIINVLSKEIEDQGWFKGELNGKIGVFPDNFVELIRVPSNASSSTDHPDSVTTADKPLPPRPGKQISSVSSPSAVPPVTSSNNNNSSSSSKSNVNGKSESSSHSKSSGIFANLTKKSSSSKVTSSPSATTSAAAASSSSSVSAGSAAAAAAPSVSSATSSLSSSTSSNSSSRGIIIKPDIIPDASNTMILTETNGSSDGPTSFSDMDVSGSKLSHITATRPKGPSNRRPPSYIALNPTNAAVRSDSLDQSATENGHHATGESNGKVTSPSSSLSKGKEDPPAWMVELRKTQEAKKQGKDSSLPSLNERQSSIDSNDGPASLTSNSRPSVTGTTSSSSSKPVVTASNRASGDFSNRINQFAAAAAQPVTDATPVSILKPIKPVKPGVTSTTTPAAAAVSSPTSATPAAVVSQVKKDPAAGPPVLKSAVNAAPAAAFIAPVAPNAPSAVSGNTPNSQSTTTSAVVPDATASSSALADLQREVRIMRQTLVPKTEYDDLLKQVHELKDLVEQQKQSQGKIVKELINDLAEERKKLAMLTIEVDRLRKLSTTV